MSGKALRIGVDIGGTFTDVTVMDPADGSVTFGKALSTPDDLVRGILDAIAVTERSPRDAEFIIHGSTVAINAILERDGAKTALVTTAGFRDVYEIGRVNRPDSFNLAFRKHVPLVPRALRFEVNERMLYDGSVERPLDEPGARTVAQAVKAQEVEAVAVLFLHSYANPAHERRMVELLREALPAAFITASHHVSREQREYERTSTVAANAYVGPRVSSYLERLERHLESDGFTGNVLIMQSSGGLCDVGTAREQCIQMLESGPAAGVVASKTVSETLGIGNLICFDMGGTTAKACVLQAGAAALSSDYFIGGYNEGLAIRIPVLDIKEIGTGGGSIASVDDAGGLHVGPQSAGANPGPAAYGAGGTLPTVTDAHLVLGHLAPDRFLAGRMQLDSAAATRAVETHVAAPLKLDAALAAGGIIAIATAAMANAVRAVTTERGLDPRDFTLVAYGGAGPLHAVDVARELAIATVVIPQAPGTFSAFGMLTADLRREYAQTYRAALTPDGLRGTAAFFTTLEAEARTWLRSAGVPNENTLLEYAVDVRYVGQNYSVTIPLEPDAEHAAVKAAFDAAHQQRYSHSAPEESAEIIAARVSIVGVLSKPVLAGLSAGTGTPAAGAVLGRRRVRFDPRTEIEATVYDRARLLAGDAFEGPAIVQEDGSTTVVPAGVRVDVQPSGHLILTVNV
ncbi:MAG TPA: hydantoinase/oxoprolinase family protein [Candidatus Lustribacter sp.]|nr:hydantoinase/oxoprolinase family protein [Candidatus Lustribacter sp.]